ncbi:MAG: alcohol dehydrogenase catalytic domain-containing protein [Limosilactobacillus sp.]|uniref:zinc-binding dehydrogenase n=1 Tax=Limosilactobacillus sp. TaxID=2773925 RepID=UPI0026F69C8C|nr:alcohol dehydrogenase catalytic domain-containing protein [Limosilactobacillus sp.]
MKAAVFVKPGQMEVREAPKPELKEATDAVIKVVRACVCGSDLWWFRGINPQQPNSYVGHEAIGVIESVGSEVTSFKPGDFVIAPFSHGCGHCAACKAGFDGSCQTYEYDMHDGYQAEYLRFANAETALVKVPGKVEDYTEDQLKDLLTLSDVMATGYHAAFSAEVKEEDNVVVIGDGAVGLSGVIGAKLRGAGKIIALSHHEDRAALAREFGADVIVSERGDDAVAKVLELTDGYGADAILECVGAEGAIKQAQKMGRPGAIIGRVGVPHAETPTTALFMQNLGLRGGIASVTTHDKEVLLDAVLSGKIHPGKVFTKSFKFDDLQAAYEAMDKREAIKSYLILD